VRPASPGKVPVAADARCEFAARRVANVKSAPLVNDEAVKRIRQRCVDRSVLAPARIMRVRDDMLHVTASVLYRRDKQPALLGRGGRR